MRVDGVLREQNLFGPAGTSLFARHSASYPPWGQTGFTSEATTCLISQNGQEGAQER